MKILIIDEKKTRREELASINEEVNNTLKNCDQLHILTGNECNTFIDSWTFLGSTFNTAEGCVLWGKSLESEVCCSNCDWEGPIEYSNYDVNGYFR